ncbi:hypothetical protein Tco_0517214 [Tanacetum coccineum]
MVVEGNVLNDFPRFIRILIAEFAAGCAVNFTFKMKGDMIIKNLNLKPAIDAMMRDFLEKSTRKEGDGNSKFNSMIDDEEARDNFLKDVYTFLRKSLMDKQYRQEDIQELMRKLLEDVRNISEEFSEYINCPSWNRPLFYFNDDDDEYTVIWRRPKAITPVLSTKEPVDSLIMGDEHLDTIPEKESDELIKSSVENLVPIPRESEDLSDGNIECDVPVNDETSLTFTTFSNPLFDSNDDFTSSDDESLSDEDVPMENFKIYSNPLFDDEEIISSTKIDPHSFNAKSNLIESLLNRDTLIDSSPKFDFLFEELSGELAHIDQIPPIIEKADFDLEEEIRLVENFFDSLMEEIDVFLASDDSMPLGIKDDDYDSEGDIRFLEELLSNDSLLLPEFESFHFVLSFHRPPSEPPDVEISLIFEPDVPTINNLMSLTKKNVLTQGERLIFLKMIEITIPSHLSLGFSFHISLTLRFLPYFPPPEMRTPFLTLASPS